MRKSDSLRSALAPRANIGVLVPGRNTTVEPELNDMRPPGVTNHAARMSFAGAPPGFDPTTAKVGQFDFDIHGAIDRMTSVRPDLVLLGHSHDSFMGGVAGGKQMQDELTAHAGVPVVVPSLAFVAAIGALGVRDVSILTPYLSADDGMVAAFFEDAGCRVRRVKGLQYDTAYAIAATAPARVRDILIGLDGDDVDAVLQVGTNLPAARVAATAEFWLGKPVLSVNVVSYWFALRQLGIADQRPGFGVLFSDH